MIHIKCLSSPRKKPEPREENWCSSRERNGSSHSHQRNYSSALEEGRRYILQLRLRRSGGGSFGSFYEVERAISNLITEMARE